MSDRNNARFLKIFLFVFAVAFVVLVAVLITALDRLRYAQEQTTNALRQLQEALMSIDSIALDEGSVANSVQQQPVATVNVNAKYYDRNAVAGDRMIRSISADVSSLNPLTVNELDQSVIYGFVNSSLAEYDYANPGVFVPMLAEKWSCSEDHLIWHITLRKNVFWHDFTDPVTHKQWKRVPVTAHDFKFRVDAIKNPDVDCDPSRGYLKDVKEVKVVNDYEFDVIWEKPYFLSESVTLSLSPLPKHVYWDYDGPFDGKKFNDDAERNKIMVGCGPYRFVSWKRGEAVVLERNETYFGRRLGVMPSIKTIVFKIVQSPNTRLQAMKSGDLDETDATASQWISETAGPEFDPKSGSIRKVRYPHAVFNYIGLNQRNPLFSDRRVRIALSHLVNRGRILKDVYHNLAVPVSGPAFVNGPCYDKTILPYAFDAPAAKKLLAEAGWKDTNGDGFVDKDGKTFRFTLVFPGANPNYAKIGAILKEDFALAGVQLELMSLEWSVVVQRVEKKTFDAAMLGWSSSISEGDPYQIWHSDHADKDGSSNFISFKNPACDEIINAIHQEFNGEKRLSLQRKLHRLLHEEQPYLFLFSQDNLDLISSRYQNFRVFPTGVVETTLWTPKAMQRLY